MPPYLKLELAHLQYRRPLNAVDQTFCLVRKFSDIHGVASGHLLLSGVATYHLRNFN